jgi:hypothetical protein
MALVGARGGRAGKAAAEPELLQYVLNITKCVELLGVMTASRVSEKALIVLLHMLVRSSSVSPSSAHTIRRLT